MQQTEPITLNLSPQAARAFRAAPREEQERIQAIVELSLQLDRDALDEEAFQASGGHLRRAAREMGEAARKRGITDEILQAILNEKKT
jgi:hypothetical protein